MEMDKQELETFKIDQMFIELIALGEKRREKYPISAISGPLASTC